MQWWWIILKSIIIFHDCDHTEHKVWLQELHSYMGVNVWIWNTAWAQSYYRALFRQTASKVPRILDWMMSWMVFNSGILFISADESWQHLRVWAQYRVLIATTLFVAAIMVLYPWPLQPTIPAPFIDWKQILWQHFSRSAEHVLLNLKNVDPLHCITKAFVISQGLKFTCRAHCFLTRRVEVRSDKQRGPLPSSLSAHLNF